MEFHLLSEIFPLMGEADFQGLARDIEKNGLLDPIWTYEGKILDGRHRYRSCIMANVLPRYKPYEGSDPLGFVLSVNLRRRHLNESQRAMIGARIATLERGRPKENVEISTITQEDAGRMLNVSRESIISARKVIDQAVPEVVQAVESGKMAVSQASKLTDKTPEYQKEVAEKVLSGVKTTEAMRQVKKERLPETLSVPTSKYRVIYADPPWSYGNDRGQADPFQYPSASDHYPTMTIKELCDLPVKDWTDPDAVLFLWVTSPLLEECFEVIQAWGFRYKSSFVWDKIKHNMGHYNSVRHEFLLICTKGSCTPDIPTLHDSVVTLTRTDRHSEKPEEFRTLIDSLYLYGKKLELFSRKKVAGWEAYGNESS